MDIFKEFTFDAAHYLPLVPEDHKCGATHGHTYYVTITVRGEVVPETGWVIDYADINSAFKPILAQLDHQCLNEIPGLGNPTCEVLAIWIWDKLTLPGLFEIRVKETASAGCAYRGEPFDPSYYSTGRGII